MENKLSLLLSSNGLTNQRITEAFNDIARGIGANSVVLLSVQKSYDDKKWTDYHINNLMQMGYRVTHFNLSEDTDISKLNEGQILYVCGGNTFQILKLIKDKGLFLPLQERIGRGDFYFGISAGSIICCPDISIAEFGYNEQERDRNEDGLSDFNAFNAVPFYIFPHYNEKEEKELQRFYSEKKKAVIGLNDDQALAVNAGGISVIGDDTQTTGLGIEVSY